MNYLEARNKGYKLGDTAYQRGYVSRKAYIDDLPVHKAGGRRKGQLYVLLPSYRSTQYCIRQYLVVRTTDELFEEKYMVVDNNARYWGEYGVTWFEADRILSDLKADGTITDEDEAEIVRIKEA